MGLLPKMQAEDQDVLKAEKEGKTREIRVTVFPEEGGPPYVADVEVDEQGLFELRDDSTTYKVSRGSLWQEGAHVRGLVNEGNPKTISPETLNGSDAMHPRLMHGLVRNNLWTQLDEIQSRKSPWRSGTTWAMMAGGLALLLMILWQIKTIGDGFSQLADAIRSIRLAGGRGGTHQDISPRDGWLLLVAGLPGWLQGGE